MHIRYLYHQKKRKALITEFEENEAEPDLQSLIEELDHEKLDLILVEGFKREHFSKIELHRKVLQKPYLYEQDQDIIALASDDGLSNKSELPILDINNPQNVADFILQLVKKDNKK